MAAAARNFWINDKARFQAFDTAPQSRMRHEEVPCEFWQDNSYTDVYWHSRRYVMGDHSGPLNVYGPSERELHLFVCYLTLPRAKAQGVHLYKMQTPRVLDAVCKAQSLQNPTRCARASAKLGYLARIRGVKSIGKQNLKLQAVTGIDPRTLKGILAKAINEIHMPHEQADFIKAHVSVVISSERTWHLRGRNHRNCAKDFDITRMPPLGGFAAWKARQFEEVKLIEQSLDVPLVVESKLVSMQYRDEVKRLATLLNFPPELRDRLIRDYSEVVAVCARDAETAASRRYTEEFKCEPKSILVGLDRNGKAAAIMHESVYRAGMQDTYARDTAHYEAITDPATAASAIHDCEQRIWELQPRWMYQRPLKLGYEYLNLKEK